MGTDAGANLGYGCADFYALKQPVTSTNVQYDFNNKGLNIKGTYNIHGWRVRRVLVNRGLL